LAQYAAPDEILRAPANDFVASFVGRDRGFRHLGFSPSDGVTIHPVRTVTPDQLGQEGSSEEWRLVVDDALRPLGWAGPGTGTGPVMVPGGSLFRKGDTLRRALDAALSSPSGLGVVIDDDGRAAGVIVAAEVLAVIESDRNVRHGGL
jgi:osmoprotectant transport system ATP-binding protein